jgi:lycopene cyclase domain-containing protein
VERFEYLILMGLCLLVTLPLELVLGARVWRQPRRLLLALVPVVVVFSLWDVVAIARGTWDYSRRFTSGVLLPFSMPLEELVFFVVIPLCGLLTYEAVGNVLTWAGRRGGRDR